MVAFSDETRARWEQERERREIAELERYAALLLALQSGEPQARA